MVKRADGRGFASVNKDRQRQIASMGGKAAHAKGTAHKFTSEEGREAGRKGGKVHSREHMRAIGARGGRAHARKRYEQEGLLSSVEPVSQSGVDAHQL